MQRQTQLANDLWPLLLPRIQAMFAAAGSGGGGGGGGAVNLAVHELGGTQHKGTLRNDQAPQFLLLDGTRPLAGSLAVDTGVTIDGVDVSAHAADPNAHHAKQHGITDTANHSAIGALQYQIVGIPTAGTVGYLTPKSSPAANEIVKTDGSSSVTLVDLTVTSDLFMTGYLDFGTNTMHEDASYLQVTGSKVVKFNQNIGNANWTVFNAGGAQFTGNVDIISGGDLTVTGSGSYAGNTVLFADSSGGNVGIMRAPDSQFALDIAGPARADYWIGPHAIQLKNVLLLSHFDGRAPYETNYSGEPNGHMGQVATTSGGVIFRPGKFYKALQMAPAATNLVTNPSFEAGTTGWGTDFGGATTITNPGGGYIGEKCATIANSGTSNFYGSAITVTNNTYYTATFWYKSNGTVSVRVREYGTSTNLSTENITATEEWKRYTITVLTPASGSTNIRLVFVQSGNVTFSLDAVQVEVGATATPYLDGSLGSGHAWTSTAHGSTSTRTISAFTYPTTGNINAAHWTIMAWVNAAGLTYTDQVVLLIAGTSAGYIMLKLNSTGKPQVQAGTSAVAAASAITPGEWTHLAAVYDGATVYLYVNGQYSTKVASSGFSGMPATMSVGCHSGGSTFNGWIDDLVILDRALVVAADNTCAEVRSIYESNAPVFAESSVFTFRPTPKGLIWADDEGLWMRESSGYAVFGIYGGESTKSWGGFTMSPGDVLIGNNSASYSAIFWDQSTGKFGFYGSGSGTPQVEIATDGKLTAGAGKVVLDIGGFHAFNAAANLALDINSEGIYMRDGGPRTTITSWTSGSRIRWGALGEIYGADPEVYLDDSSISRTLYPTVIRAIRQGNDAALIELAAVRSDTGAGAKIIIGEGFRLKDYYGAPDYYNTNRVVHAMADDIVLESTNLQLRSLTTSTGAVGTYAGKVKIRINGTDRYIPYYAS